MLWPNLQIGIKRLCCISTRSCQAQALPNQVLRYEAISMVAKVILDSIIIALRDETGEAEIRIT